MLSPNYKIKTIAMFVAMVLIFSFTIIYARAEQAKMTATVAGWYEVQRIDNESLDIKTNMRVWLNGKEIK